MILVGGVSELFQGDLDLGRRAVEILGPELAGPEVSVEDLYYGPVAIAQRIAELAPVTLVLVGTALRGRPAGTLGVEQWKPPPEPGPGLQAAIGDAVVGYVGIDLIVQVGVALGVLPDDVVIVDVEPASTAYSEKLSSVATGALARAVDAVRALVAERAKPVAQACPPF